jgi:hypothetical protein
MEKLECFHFHPSLISVGKATSLPLEWSPIRGSNLVGSSLVHKYLNRVEAANTQAYYDMTTTTAVKGFMVQALAATSTGRKFRKKVL